MRDTQGQDIWFTGLYDERCSTAAKQLSEPNGESRVTIHDTVIPEGTTVGSAQESSPSGSEALNSLDACIPTVCEKDLPRNAGRHRSSARGDEAQPLPLPTKHCNPPACLWSSSSEPYGKAHGAVGADPCASFKGAISTRAESSSPGQELEAFSHKLQQALLQVKRQAEDGFVAAQASVSERLVEQLNAEREKELQRLEDARQEAEGARNLLYSLRRSKESLEERMSRMLIYLRRQALRQQARRQQQEALYRWQCFAVRRKHQRLEKNIVTLVSERIRTWRVFIPWRIAALRTVSARRQQKAARQAQVVMDNHLRLAEEGKARGEQQVRDLRQQLLAETALRLRLQENLRRIFLEGASAVCGRQDNGYRGTLSGSVNLCRVAHAPSVTGHYMFNSQVGCTNTSADEATKSKSSALPKQIQGACSRATEKSPKVARAATFHTRGGARAKAEVGTVGNRVLPVSGCVRFTVPQRSTDVLTTRLGTAFGYKALHSTGEDAQSSRPSAVTEETVQGSDARFPRNHSCLCLPQSLEVIGQMLVPGLPADVLPAARSELLTTSEAATVKSGVSSCVESMPSLCGCTTSCNAGTMEDVYPHECGSGGLGEREGSRFDTVCAHHQSTAAKVHVGPPSTAHHRMVYQPMARHRERPTQGPSTSTHMTDRMSCKSGVNHLFVTTGNTNLLSCPSELGSIGWATDRRQRSKICILPDTVGTNCKRPGQFYADRYVKSAKEPLKSTVTYPGGVEANQKYPYATVLRELPRSQDRAALNPPRIGNTTPDTGAVCRDGRPPVGSCAGRLPSRKHCSWTQSC